MQIAICGIGQWYQGDDAAGLTIVDQWQKNRPPTADIDVRLITAPAVELPDVLWQADAILLVDAVRSKRPDRNVILVKDIGRLSADMWQTSSHGLGTIEVIRMIRNLPGQQNKPVILIGIEVSQCTLGDPLSAELEKRIPLCLKIIDREIQRLSKRLPAGKTKQ